MLQTGNKKVSGFSLVEILVSMGIFSVIITSVVFITISMINAQKKIQARLFLTQTAQTTLESMSRQLRYGYSYSGWTASSTDNLIVINYDSTTYDSTAADFTTACEQYTDETTTTCLDTKIETQKLASYKNSPFVLFESQDGNPDSLQDQNAFCVFESKLYKISDFNIDTAGEGIYSKNCSDGNPMLPDDVFIDYLTFDVFADVVDNPKSPRVRIKMKLRHEDGGAIEIQSTVTQRLVTYF